MRLLTADDSTVVRKIIRGAAEVLEFELLEAEDGIEALKKLEEAGGRVDLILLDWNMPRLNGYETLIRIKRDAQYKGIPVMMVTTESQKENIVSAVKAGATQYLIKPFTMEELIKKMMECLGKGGL